MTRTQKNEEICKLVIKDSAGVCQKRLNGKAAVETCATNPMVMADDHETVKHDRVTNPLFFATREKFCVRWSFDNYSFPCCKWYKRPASSQAKMS